MFIPKKIIAGFVERNDTYTNKLAFVTYYDDKGELRQERSWKGWIDEEIPTQEYINEPTEGFVLNKPVGGTGGYRYSHGRQAKIRIYDPRGFEFEIKPDNLLFILQETSSQKGKGLIGEFVYCWYGKDIFLMPVNCEEYRIATNGSEKQKPAFDSTKIVPGREYVVEYGWGGRLKANFVYLGLLKYNRFDFKRGRYSWRDWTGRYDTTKGSTIPFVCGKSHIFASKEDINDPETRKKFFCLKNFSKIESEVSELVSEDYYSLLNQYENSCFNSKPKGFVLTESSDKPDYKFVFPPEGFVDAVEGRSIAIMLKLVTPKPGEDKLAVQAEVALSKKGLECLYMLQTYDKHDYSDPRNYFGSLFNMPANCYEGIAFKPATAQYETPAFQFYNLRDRVAKQLGIEYDNGAKEEAEGRNFFNLPLEVI